MNLNRAALRRASCLGAAALLAMTLGAVGPTSSTRALGPVVAVTPYEVAVPNLAPGYDALAMRPSLSGRGETAGAFALEIRENVWAQFDVAGPEPTFDGLGITVSGDGCAVLWADLIEVIGVVQVQPTIQLMLSRRCPGFEERPIGPQFTGAYDGQHGLALSHDGRYGVAVLPPAPGGSAYRVVRIDTNSGAMLEMPLPGGYSTYHPYVGVDISDNGNVVVATAVSLGSTGAVAQLPSFSDVVAWDVPSNGIAVLSNPNVQAVSGFASISGDGRFVSFAASKPLAGGESNTGPWVYVTDRSNGAIRRVSGAGDASFHSSISRDGSQVAYTVSRGGCYPGQDQLFIQIGQTVCPGTRVDVAYSPTPGFTTAPAVETISVLANGGQGGLHVEPALSGNGRWIAWISNAGTALIGPDSNLNGRHVFMRRRDPGLAVDPIDFGTIAVNTSSTLTTTVRNTGRTSVSLDAITASPGQFTIQGGGSCAGGSLLPPGATCTVNVRYLAPGINAQNTGTITVAEGGYDAISAAGNLIGRASFTPPPTTTTTTTTTTLPGGRPPPTTTTTTTTVPGVIEFIADPNPVDYGQVAVGIASPIQTVTISNTGTVGGQLLTELLGDNPDDFFVARNGCNAVVLAPAQSCTMEIMMIPLAGGLRKASLVITLGGVSGEVELSGTGHFAPQLLASPGAITTNGITTIIGRGFPPGGTFDVHFDPTGIVIPATADALGMFRIPFSAFRTLELGNYVLRVDPLPDVFELVRGQLVVVLPTFEPQGPNGPAFGPEALIVTRGK